MARKRYTDVAGTLGSGGLTNVATTHTLTSLTRGDGATFATLAAGEWFWMSILDASGNVLEVVKVTAWDSGTKAITIVRAQQGYTAIAHAGSLKVALSVYPDDFDGSGTGTLAFVQYAPAIGLAKTTTSSTAVDVDATNLILPTFVGPPSGLVLVTFGAYASISGGTASTFRWGLRSGSSNVTGSFLEAMSGLPAAPFSVSACVALPVTPGTSYTWKWAFYRNSGSSTCFIFAGADADGGTAPATMKVDALP